MKPGTTITSNILSFWY